MQTEKRKSFIIYTDYSDFLQDLDNDEVAEIFRAMLNYAAGGEPAEFSDRHVRAVFRMIRNQMDRDNEKYIDICRKRREAGKKSAESRRSAKSANAEAAEQISANSTDNDNENVTDTENETDNENVTDTENDNEKNLSCAFSTHALNTQDKNFEKFAQVYPRRANMDSALKEWKKLAPDEKLTERIVSAVNAAKKSSQWTEDGGRYIPFPAKWLREKRWEECDNMQESAVRDYSKILDQALGKLY